MKKMEKLLTLRLSKEDYDTLYHMSCQTEIPISQIIRFAIKEFFKQEVIKNKSIIKECNYDNR